MNKEERIARYGEEAYDKKRKPSIEWNKRDPEKVKTSGIEWRLLNPEKLKIANEEINRKGGTYYEYKQEYNKTGIPGEKNKIRYRHANQYRPYKNIIAPWSIINHQWIPGTSEYTGVALVEKDQHQHGYIDVIEILEGEITLLSEKEIKGEGVIR